MAVVYVYVMDTMADWEVSNVMAELNSKRFFKKDAPDIEIKTVALLKEAVRSMGGLTILPDCTVDEIVMEKGNMLILPGSDVWNGRDQARILDVAQKFLENGLMVAAVCGATMALANMGVLDNRMHTSNGLGFLEMFCPSYRGTENYVDEPAVKDRNLITAGATGGLMMAKYCLEYLDVFREDTLEYWYSYFKTGDAKDYFAMVQTLQ